MYYVETFDINQMMMTILDSMVSLESTARLIDAFVNSLTLVDYDIKEIASEGRTPYDSKNVEVKWLLGRVEPDLRTISDFWKENIDRIKKIFHEFNRCISGAVKW